MFVPNIGIEPICPHGHEFLKLARLPSFANRAYAEAENFEIPMSFRTPVFKTGAVPLRFMLPYKFQI